MTAVDLVRELALPGRGIPSHGADNDQTCRETLVSSLEDDLQGARQSETLLALCDMLGNKGDQSLRAAVVQVLDSVSWEFFGLVMDCLEQPVGSVSSAIDGGGGSGISNGSKSPPVEEDPLQRAERVSALSEKLALTMAEIFSPKELHIIALEHLHVYKKDRTVRTVLTVLRRSWQRMTPVRRAKFLQEALRPVLNAVKRTAETGETGDTFADAQREQEEEWSSDDADGVGDDGDDEADGAPNGVGDGGGGGSRDGAGAEEAPPPRPPPPPPQSPLPPPPPPDHEPPSHTAYQAATAAAEIAAGFAGPLIEQAYEERTLLVCGTKQAPAAAASPHPPAEGPAPAPAPASGSVDHGEAAVASDKSLAAFLGFALSALELTAETSVCTSAATAAATAAAAAANAAAAYDSASAPPTRGLEDEGLSAAAVGEAAGALARAEERLVGLVINGPDASSSPDLQFVLLHGYRLAHADLAKQQRRRSRRRRRSKKAREASGAQDEEEEEEEDEEEEEEDERERQRGRMRTRTGYLSSDGGGGLVGLGEAAVSGPLPWTLRGVSNLAYLVACEPKLREKWLPLVWSRQTERRLFLPHAEVLMRDGSKRIASKGLELACFVAERLGRFPDRTGSFAFDWDPEGAGAIGGGDSSDSGDAWNGVGSREEAEGAAATESTSAPPQPRRRWDPHRFDLAAFLQVLVDVMVSCPLPSLRARGHAALSAFLGAADEACRFRVLRGLVERCPWPNA
ncbi:unnamed protein product, partial [Scytosiphon promiscuus]